MRNFSSDGLGRGSISLINLAKGRLVKGASIKGQCKKAGFHDYKAGVEAALGRLEGLASTAIKNIIETNTLPSVRSADHEALAVFSIIQRSRTLSAAEQADKMADRMFKVAYEKNMLGEGIDPSHFEIRSEYPVAIPLSVAAQCAPIALSLGMHLFVNDADEEFIASDNPIIAHNQYCEGISYQGVLGWGCSGIQILLPISPYHLLLFYDGEVYGSGARGNCNSSKISNISEVREFNAFQILGARENIYFSNAAMADPLFVQINRLKNQRQFKRHITVQTNPIASGSGTSEVVHQFERMIPLKFRQSALKIKRNLRRVPLRERASMVRTSFLQDGGGEGRSTGSSVRYTARRSFAD